MTRTEMGIGTLLYSPLNHLKWLLAREYFITHSVHHHINAMSCVQLYHNMYKIPI